jgi:tetratricopeptide (TPR) repeat protein
MEQSFLNPGQPLSKNAFDRNELPEEVCLELACSYYNRGLVAETESCLKIAGEHPLALYWRGYLLSRSGKPYDELIVQANQLSPERVFPFRTELLPILKWAALAGNNWKPLYYLALLLKEKNQPAEALELLTQLGEKPDFAPFYAVRALWNAEFPVKMVRDFQKAASLDPNEWRYVKLQVQYYIKQKYYPTALQLVEAYRTEHPGNVIMDMLYAKTLLLDRQFANCDALLSKLTIIPFEGATEGRSLYWEAKLMQAVDQFDQQKYPRALQFIQQALQWPENLGVGKPYESDLDSRLENWMQYLIYQKTGKLKEAGEALDRILNFKPGVYNTVQNFQPANHLVTALAMAQQGKKSEATEWLNQQIKKYPEMNTLKWARDVFMDPQRAGERNDEPAIRILQRLLK